MYRTLIILVTLVLTDCCVSAQDYGPLVPRALTETRGILCSYYPSDCHSLGLIAEPGVQFSSRSWVNWRHLVLVRGETRQFSRQQIRVSTSGGESRVYARLRHECLHYLILNSVIPQSANQWVDHYWTRGT